MKVFISQPMNGKTDEEILNERKVAIDAIKKAFKDDDVSIIDSYFEDYEPKNGNIALKYLAKSLELLADADIAYFTDGWRKTRGCLIEHECAKQYGIKICND